MSNYQEAIQWIHSREKFKVKPGLKRMEWMMEELGHPEKKLKAIHIAGTNGKGSTVTFLSNLLQTQGYDIGTFTSPYIIRFNERISVNGEAIPDAELAALTEAIKPLAEKLKGTSLGEPTEFEIITAMAVIYFSQKHLDFILFEVGLGGRYDSTNIIQPLLSVITNIGLDHINILGNTLEQIAYEKAGIIKTNTPLITGTKEESALSVLKEQASVNKAPVSILGENFQVEHIKSSLEGEYFEFKTSSFHSGDLLSPMKGRHQVDNAALALQTMEHLKKMGVGINRTQYSRGLLRTHWPARFETISTNPVTIIDGAHNEEGTRALVDTMKRHFSGKRVHLIYSALEDKPVKNMLEILKEVVDVAYMTTFEFPRAMTGSELTELSPIPDTITVSDYVQAIREATSTIKTGDVLLITGSLYFISEIRKYFEY
ncbi:dihydrofolate synthase / folylpolyglutamate synthase [Halobacillus alkaliphilus]|uniref:Dihydrofolate synthase/folylpolyglutamate synthase n=1 Tax=Halobacillus alkaliphilus TaxID=396056 RepID=A0A1I2R1S6_9BACI|nr:folylpolyglutamate synthase/dihydrofolate synthase family protein [Halobacillus alkaliphilus]SFG34502.1 dihydrofolate synthase / folylpolyglutamate synthase [Halobacillus alkaliphilus]